ncbi:MAG: aminopeptidase P family protein, partial [Ghiorsea sp.]|nr:aminopeptidase P family protein [Ghiorsea sp.]
MNTAKLLISDSEHHADMLYISGLFVPDAFIVIGLEDNAQTTWHGLLSPLEVDRAKAQSKLHHVHLDSLWHDKARQYDWQRSLSTAAAAFLKEHNVKYITVPADFPFLYAQELIALGFEVSPSPASLFPQRVVKTEDEIIQLTHA